MNIERIDLVGVGIENPMSAHAGLVAALSTGQCTINEMILVVC